jgi:predicted O-methyltransferase YrrM
VSLLRTAVLWIPAIRRLHESRGALLAERDSLIRKIVPPAVEDPNADEVRAAHTEGRLIITEYPYHPRSRPLEASAGGMRLKTRFQAEQHRYAATLRDLAHHIGSLLRIPREEQDASGPFWANDWFPPLDGVSLYGLIAETAPRRYIEVGSGISTRFARRAIQDMGLPTRIVSIDPHPHTVVDSLCDEVVRSRMEDVPRDFWDGIEQTDMLFVDNSHRSFPNSDVTVFFAEVLPALRPGTIWGLHDIFCRGTIQTPGATCSTMSSISCWRTCWAVRAVTRSYFQRGGVVRTSPSQYFGAAMGSGRPFETLARMAGAFGCDAAPRPCPRRVERDKAGIAKLFRRIVAETPDTMDNNAGTDKCRIMPQVRSASVARSAAARIPFLSPFAATGCRSFAAYGAGWG